MEWPEIRKAYKALRVARGLNQDQVEGMAQGMVAKLESNRNLGPTVGTFVKAVNGLGVPVSTFFAQLESGQPVQAVPDDAAQTGQKPPKYSPTIKEAFATLGEQLNRLKDDLESATQDRRPPAAPRPDQTADGMHHRRRARGHAARKAARRP